MVASLKITEKLDKKIIKGYAPRQFLKFFESIFFDDWEE